MVHSSGLHRDTFPYPLELVDEAVRKLQTLMKSMKRTMSDEIH
ncbi:hypothetical protein [Methanosarcina sp. WWM596]|nr:hypothetical protein [Methanosarcina sp. WWM596]